MVAKKVIIQADDIFERQAEAGQVPAHVDLFEPEVDEYAELFAGLTDGDEEKVLLYRIIQGTQKQGLLCRLEPGASVEDIPGRFGGGDYIIKRLHSGVFVKSARLYVEGEPKVERVVEIQQAQAIVPAPDMRDIIGMMQESNRQLIAGLASVFQPAQQPPQTSRMDMLTEMAAMKNLFGGDAQPASNPMDMLIKGMQLAADMTPRQGGDTSGMDVLLESIKSFAPAIGAVVAQSARPQRQAARAPQQTPQLAAPAIVPPNPEVLPIEDEDTMLLKYYLNMLVGFAAEGRDPVLYADLIADQLPESKIDELLSKPDIVAYLITIAPGVAGQREWFEAVAAELKTMFSLTEPEIAATVGKIENAAIENNDGNNLNIT